MMSNISNEIKQICDRILKTMELNNISYGELSTMTGIPKSALHRYATGETPKIPLERIQLIAKALGVSSAWIMGWAEENDNKSLPNNIIPMPKMNKIPLIGTIACGTPITAVENIECEVDIPEHINADFALRCKGDSMIDARINDGDIVYIRQQPIVENGEIAVVLIENEATLKRFYREGNTVTLMPCNSKHKPFFYSGEQLNEIRILGKAVGFTSTDI